MAQNNPLAPASMLTSNDISAWYQDNPFPLGTIDAYFPLEENMEDTWKTIAPISYMTNEAADPLSQHSSIPVSGRNGFKIIMGGMAEFGKGREMDSKEIEKFETLKRRFAATKNPQVAQQLINYYGGDLAFLRTSMMAEKLYLCYAILSNACNIGFVAANSPYMQGITAMDYAVETWQKNNVTTSWANIASLILDDIESVRATAEARGKVLTKIKINKTWFNYVRNNTQVQKYCASLVSTLLGTQSLPTLEAINSMMASHFNTDIQFEVINELVTRANADGTKTTTNPFADGVAVFTATSQVGRFEWNPIYIDDATRETAESFFITGNYKNIDPNYNKIYVKGKGFPVVDTYADNFYLKINAVAW
jgi:hypothetical protein